MKLRSNDPTDENAVWPIKALICHLWIKEDSFCPCEFFHEIDI